MGARPLFTANRWVFSSVLRQHRHGTSLGQLHSLQCDDWVFEIYQHPLRDIAKRMRLERIAESMLKLVGVMTRNCMCLPNVRTSASDDKNVKKWRMLILHDSDCKTRLDTAHNLTKAAPRKRIPAAGFTLLRRSRCPLHLIPRWRSGICVVATGRPILLRLCGA